MRGKQVLDCVLSGTKRSQKKDSHQFEDHPSDQIHLLLHSGDGHHPPCGRHFRILGSSRNFLEIPV